MNQLEYHFIIYAKDGNVLWQFVKSCLDKAEAKQIAEAAPTAWNIDNDDNIAADCRFCTLSKWLETLRFRGV